MSLFLKIIAIFGKPILCSSARLLRLGKRLLLANKTINMLTFRLSLLKLLFTDQFVLFFFLNHVGEQIPILTRAVHAMLAVGMKVLPDAKVLAVFMNIHVAQNALQLGIAVFQPAF